jgi:hypothetical protein
VFVQLSFPYLGNDTELYWAGCQRGKKRDRDKRKRRKWVENEGRRKQIKKKEKKKRRKWVENEGRRKQRRKKERKEGYREGRGE